MLVNGFGQLRARQTDNWRPKARTRAVVTMFGSAGGECDLGTVRAASAVIGDVGRRVALITESVLFVGRHGNTVP